MPGSQELAVSAADLGDDPIAVVGGVSEPCKFLAETSDLGFVAFHGVGPFGESFAEFDRALSPFEMFRCRGV